MNRPITEDDLHAYVDGALSNSRRADLEAYLTKNTDVAERYARFSAQRDALRAALAPVAAEPVPLNLNLGSMVASRHRLNRSSWRIGAAACLLVFVGGAGGWLLRDLNESDPVGINALAQEAFHAFTVFGVDRGRPVEIAASDSATLRRWVEDRLSHSISLPDLSVAGYQFMGGRLVATQNGPAGFLMYDDKKNGRIAILMRPMRRDQDVPIAEHREGGVVGYAWADNGMGYSVVGGIDTAELLKPIVNEARRQIESRT